jgi:hypothetical protein
MVMFPLSFLDLDLLFAVVAIILFSASELLFYYTGKMSILVDRGRLRFAGIVFSILFLILIGIRVANIIRGDFLF